jgi:hypothetical protein
LFAVPLHAVCLQLQRAAFGHPGAGVNRPRRHKALQTDPVDRHRQRLVLQYSLNGNAVRHDSPEQVDRDGHELIHINILLLARGSLV